MVKTRTLTFNCLAVSCLAVLLASCLPTVTLDTGAPVIPGARAFGTLSFGPYETYYEAHYEAHGEAGEPVLLIHGIGGGSSLFQYRNNAGALAEAGYRVYSIDLLGFGRSSRPAIRYTQDLHVAQIEAFITSLGEPVTVVANGLSAAYSIRLAAERPDLVRRLVLISPTGYARLDRPANEARISDFARFTGFLGTLLYGVLLDEGSQRFFLLDAYVNESSLTPEVLASYDRNLKVENAQWVIFSFISGNLDQPVGAYWPGLEQPTLILWGEEAQTTPPSDAQAFLEARPEAGLVLIDGAKLLPNEDRPERFNREVLDFLAR